MGGGGGGDVCAKENCDARRKKGVWGTSSHSPLVFPACLHMGFSFALPTI